MNKHVINALSSYEFTYEKYTAYGQINGYEVNVLARPLDIGPIFIFSTYISLEKKNAFINRIKSKRFSMVSASALEFGVVVAIGVMTPGGVEKKFKKVLPVILSLLDEFEAPKKDVCPLSGIEMDDLNSKLVPIPELSIKVRLTNDAIANVNNQIEKINEEYEEAPNNYLKGVGGLLIGALVGVLLTIGLGLLGYITAFASFISIILGTFLYSKFGGKQNKMMILMSFAITTISILLAVFVIYIIQANNLMRDADLSYRGMDAFKYSMANSEQFKRAFLLDLGLNLVFIIIGIVVSFFTLKKMIKRPKKVE